MNPFTRLVREVKYICTTVRTLRNLAHIDPDSTFVLPDEWEKKVDQYRDNDAFIFGDTIWSYGQFDAYANRVAHWAVSAGLVPGDTLALFCKNRLEYVALWFGLSKIGIKAALIGDQLQGQGLAHCLSVAKSKIILCDGALASTAQTSFSFLPKPLPLWCFDGPGPYGRDFDAALLAASARRPDRQLRAHITGRDTLLNMFTSGTTGLPKSVRVSHVRAQRYSHSFTAAMNARPTDRMLMVLPMYHATGGICGVGTALMNGGAVIVEPGFSARTFWQTAILHRATLFTYVGEVCRFLTNAPPGPNDKKHTIHAMLGNGLRPEIWRTFQRRFGIQTIAEFYGSTEGNVGLMNANGQVGAMGRIPWYVKHAYNIELVAHDFETGEIVRDPNGHCIKVPTGETGEAIGRIDASDPRFLFEGYGNEQETKKKILTDVFAPGDRYFRTGDLMRRDKQAYYYFVDRVGDTFRWMAQNVATGEVAAVLGNFTGVQSANVYGVKIPGFDGRAGMSALVLDGAFDGAALYQFLEQNLPVYAQPVFVRIVQMAETTSTFKFKKTDLVETGFDLQKTNDPIFVRSSAKQAYVKLTPAFTQEIMAGSVRF